MSEFVLFVSHHIYLTREQRYALADGESVKTVAPSIPVWFYKFNTSEPATEVFCRYILSNQGDAASLEFAKDGYVINIPQIPKDYQPPERIPDEQWRKMTCEQQSEWYENNPTPPSGTLLRDVSDGGSAYIKFQFDVQGRRHKKMVRQSHQIEIKDMSKLLESLIL